MLANAKQGLQPRRPAMGQEKILQKDEASDPVGQYENSVFGKGPPKALSRPADEISGFKVSRIYAHATTEMQATLEASTAWNRRQQVGTTAAGQGDAAKKSGGSAGSGMASIPFGFIEVFPRLGKKGPQLLSMLESGLQDRMHAAERLVSTSRAGALQRGQCSNVYLDAHRAILDEFISNFPTYEPFLRSIKAELDMALDTGLRCARENMDLRRNLASIEEQLVMAVDRAHTEAVASAAEERQKLHSLLIQAEQRALKAEARLRLAQSEVLLARKAAENAAKQREKLEAATARLRAGLEQEETWASKSPGKEVSQLIITSVTPADIEEVEGEPMTSSAPADSVVYQRPEQPAGAGAATEALAEGSDQPAGPATESAPART